jgi:hypothetical protein
LADRGIGRDGSELDAGAGFHRRSGLIQIKMVPSIARSRAGWRPPGITFVAFSMVCIRGCRLASWLASPTLAARSRQRIPSTRIDHSSGRDYLD